VPRPSRQTLELWTQSPVDPGGLAGRIEDGFRFERLIGTGGIGEVYEAVRVRDDARVAIKTLLPTFRDVREAVGRLEREARAGGLLDHPNIVDTQSYGMLPDGRPYLVMELVEGADLGAALELGPLEPRRALAIGRQTLEGLAHAHAHGVVHRDLKPENLMLAPAPDGERVKILDLGLAKLVGLAAAGSVTLTETGAVFGTPAYMAPEQALGRPVTFATDIYAVGVIVFEMLTGKLPFVGADVQGTLRLHASGPIPRLVDVAPWCPPTLDQIVTQALQKDPAARFASAQRMAAALHVIERALAA
jgi:serine/threonine-protein kinase